MLRPRQTFGKYKIQRRIAEGGFADVYRARDTIEGINVALKIPHRGVLVREAFDDVLREVRLTSKLDHPNVLQIKNAEYIEKQLVVVYPLGEETLADRMSKRLSFDRAMHYTQQLLDAVSFAHGKSVAHCDIKPENIILFPNGVLKLADFGIAKIAARTLSASGSGTVGYVAPEQALGRPSLRSDVFSLGLVIYEMITNHLPEWPFEWPPPGYDRLRRKAHADLIEWLKRALSVNTRKRHANAVEMAKAFKRIKRKAGRRATTRRAKRASTDGPSQWRLVRIKTFKRLFGRALDAVHACGKCGGPVSERMTTCPWCGQRLKTFRGETKYPARCRECKRGMKLDWAYCPHEYGPAQGPRSERTYTDRRYTTTCTKPSCKGALMPFMKYCPWCRSRVQRRWKIEGSNDKCPSCGWGVLKDFWRHCPWCGRKLGK